ncbi:DNA-directed RNA polymerase I subunit rpa49 [Cladophialophora chaetospira]|uniref:DNA-directed RNA polymerase I subunit rpa49 n=1 Tax=Cladophialophora chaetospira TaxID=386627 RepID=A0AA38WZ12_9EURO|nr:DNA-directed RNA polymerase I subunit rpa49 [Cladophialophora chaetospira]
MAGEKRKASATLGERPSKKAQIGTVKVTHLSAADSRKPLIATTPGVKLPADIAFDGYFKKVTGGSSLLLQSSDHPTIDYVATESSTTDTAEKHLKHYIAVFDPASNKLKVIEAKKMTVRSTVRIPDKESKDEEDEEVTATPSSRAALTEAFGTKKSKRAVASMAENRLLARDGESDNPVSAAILSSIQEDYSDDDDLTSSTAARVNKPLPPANLDTEDIREVYDLSHLVFPGPHQTTLSQMQITYWKQHVEKNKPIPTNLRFIATRVGYLTQKHLKDPQNTDLRQKVQLLRYIQLLVEIHKFVSHQNNRKPMLPVETWPKGTTTDTYLSDHFKQRLVSAFFPTNIPTVFAKTLLTSTILALTLHIPPPKSPSPPGEPPSVLFTEPSEITLDLAMPAAEINKLYRELGCKLETMRDPELSKYGWDKVGAPTKKIDQETGKVVKLPQPKWAKLKFPVEFPKVSSGRPNGRR